MQAHRRVAQGGEGVVEHAHDLARLVVDDGVPLRIPEHRHGDAAGVVLLGGAIDLVQVARVVDRVGTVPGPGSNDQPDAPMNGWTTETGITSSSRRSARRISVRWAQGQAKET